MARLDGGISEVLASVSLKDLVFRDVAMWWLFNDVSEESAFSDLGVEGRWRWAEMAGEFVLYCTGLHRVIQLREKSDKPNIFISPFISPRQHRRWDCLGMSLCKCQTFCCRSPVSCCFRVGAEHFVSERASLPSVTATRGLLLCLLRKSHVCSYVTCVNRRVTLFCNCVFYSCTY
jgi:hypothetical protein